MKKLYLLIPILLIGCNIVQDKPCSREDVKQEVISLFEKRNPIPDGTEFYLSANVKYEGNGNSFYGIPTDNSVRDAMVISGRTKSIFIKDTIEDIFSTPKRNQTCECEATIYRYVLNQGDSVMYGATYRYNSTTRKEVIEETYTFNYTTRKYEGTKTANPPQFITTYEKIDTVKTKAEYEVKVDDEGKTHVMLYRN